VIVIPVPAMALRTSAPFSRLLMNPRNHAGFQSFGIDSAAALVMPGFEINGPMLPLAVLYFSGHIDRKCRRSVRHTKLQYEAIVLSEIPPYSAIAGISRYTERL